MAGDAPGAYQWTYPADTDLSNSGTQQFLVVQVRPGQNAAGAGQGGATVVPYDGSGKPAVGILQNCPKLGEAATVMLRGISYCIASGAWEAGDNLSVKTGGQLQKAGGSDAVFAIADQSAVAGDTSTCVLK